MRLAREFGWEIICMDSMQIYRRMDIGTAKPTPEDRRLAVHHLLDIKEPDESFSVSEYVEAAEEKIRELHAAGKEFIFVGGTGLYLQALMHPMGLGNVCANESLRAELNEMAKTADGKKELQARLAALDPETASRLPMNDIRRIIRAIEVTEGTGIPFSHQETKQRETMYEWKAAATLTDRSLLYERINRRVDRMIDLGLQKEVEELLLSGVPENAQSMSAIGYKEMIPCVRGFSDIGETIEKIRTASRHYAKRQMTFLRREPLIQYIHTEDAHAYDRMVETLK